MSVFKLSPWSAKAEPPNNQICVFRKRLAIALISMAIIGLELALIRFLSLRFWYYFASMAISLALLGFGSSGTIITLLQDRFLAQQNPWLCFLAFAFSGSIPVSVYLVQKVPLDVYYMAWNLRGELFHILSIEFFMLLPFFFSGGFICLAFMDKPERINGHYAANLIGSGIGAILTICLMHLFSTSDLLALIVLLGYLAGSLILPPWGKAKAMLTAAAVGIGLLILGWLIPPKVVISNYKKLALEQTKPGTTVIYKTEGPLGRIDVVGGPAIHDAPPGMSLQNTNPIPKRILLIVDGDQTYVIYNVRDIQDWAFLDYTIEAIPYQFFKQPDVLIIGAGGGAPIGLAMYYKSRRVTALEMNMQIIRTMKAPLAELGGKIYEAEDVEIKAQEARGFFASTLQQFDIIHVPLLDSPGGSGAGVYAARESYLYTVESFEHMIDHLSDAGVLCITLYAKNPPRDGLRVFNLAAQSLSKKGLDPARHLALIRSWETVSLLASKQPWSAGQLEQIRSFCQVRGFDLCYLPSMEPSEANRFHVLDQAYYFEATRSLLGTNRQAFLEDYLFSIEAPTDDRPYFFNFLRWRTLPELKHKLKGRMPAFLELGSLLLIAALIQALLLAVIMILLPLVPGPHALKKTKGKHLFTSVSYFLLLGIGFMLLEMGFLQKLILYLSHPIYSTSVVIAAFLILGGLGSQLSSLWMRGHDAQKTRYAAVSAAGIICIFSLGYLFLIDPWLGLTHSWSLWLRFLIAALTIAPLALAMGHLLPMGLRQVGLAEPSLIPWAWAVNGFASVIATISAPLLAMNMGFSRIIIIAAASYALAGILFQHWLNF